MDFFSGDMVSVLGEKADTARPFRTACAPSSLETSLAICPLHRPGSVTLSYHRHPRGAIQETVEIRVFTEENIQDSVWNGHFTSTVHVE